MKQLIVNADDLGADEARNAGIFEAIEAGVVTSASLLPNGPALEDALWRIRSSRRPISYGVHINLSEGPSLSGPLPPLTGDDGHFLGKAQAHRRLMSPGDPEMEKGIHREILVQSQRLLASGVRILHLDGHQHVHIFPAVRRAMMEVAKNLQIPWVRIPEEPFLSFPVAVLSEDRMKEVETFIRLAQEVRSLLAGMGIRSTDHFRGLYLRETFGLRHLTRIVDELRPGLTELMVHPGRACPPGLFNPFSAFSTADRERELQDLLHPDFSRSLAEGKVFLTPFPEAVP